MGPKGFTASSRQLYNSPRFDNVRFVINDFSSAESHGIDDDALEDYIAGRLGCASYRPEIREVCVAKSPQLLTFCQLMAHPQSSSTIGVRIFSSLAEARSWLNHLRAPHQQTTQFAGNW